MNVYFFLSKDVSQVLTGKLVFTKLNLHVHAFAHFLYLYTMCILYIFSVPDKFLKLCIISFIP